VSLTVPSAGLLPVYVVHVCACALTGDRNPPSHLSLPLPPLAISLLRSAALSIAPGSLRTASGETAFLHIYIHAFAYIHPCVCVCVCVCVCAYMHIVHTHTHRTYITVSHLVICQQRLERRPFTLRLLLLIHYYLCQREGASE